MANIGKGQRMSYLVGDLRAASGEIEAIWHAELMARAADKIEELEAAIGDGGEAAHLFYREVSRLKAENERLQARVAELEAALREIAGKVGSGVEYIARAALKEGE
jgi:hypothetical protein